MLTGGWNLLAPGDLIERTEALQMENWRVNAAGALRSRFGHGNPIWRPNPVRSFCQVKGVGVRTYFTTYGDLLWRDGLNIGGGAFGAGPIGMVSYQGYLWAMSRSAQKKDDGATLLGWTPTAPADPVLTPTAGGVLELGKVYTYWITYACTGGQESPSNANGQTTAPIEEPNQIITITTPAASADPQVIGWNVYRIGNTLQEALRLNTSVIPIGTDFVDTGDPGDGLGDVAVTDLGITLDPNSSGPPAGNGLAGPYYEKILAWGVAANPNRLYYSGTLQPYNFPGSSLDEGNHVDIGEKGEAIVNVTIRPRSATIYKDSSIWRLVGDPDDINADLERVTGEIGLIGREAVESVGAVDYFQGPEGIYVYNGERPRKITGKLDCLFRGEAPDAAGFSYPSAIALNQQAVYRARNCLAHRRGRLYFFYCGGTASTVPNRGISCELGADNWSSDSREVTAILDAGSPAVDETTGASTGTGLLFGGIDVDVVSLEEGHTDNGGPIQLAYHSGYRDQGAPDNIKTYADVVIEHNTGGASLTLSAYYDDGSTSEPIGTLTSTVKTVSTFQPNYAGDKLGKQARNIAIRIEGDSTNACTIYKVLVHYFVEPRDSKTFDSDETDLGSEKVKGFNELEIDIDYPAPSNDRIQWVVYTDTPGGSMVGRDANYISGTSGRQILRFPLALGIEGRLARVTMRSDVDTFRVYGVRLRVLVYGEYYDGSIGEKFLGLPMNVGMSG